MNILIQNILVIFVLAAAIWFLIKKFFWKTETSSIQKKIPGSCGKNGCGCH